jgi:hypothetical protein
MTFRRLFLFVEGDSDERFFRSVAEPTLRRAYQDVQFVQWSRLKREKVLGFLRSLESMKSDYIFVRDLDRYPCATVARDRLLELFPRLDPDRLQIVKTEIESWYCAGIREDHPWGTLEIARHPDTRVVTKEIFESSIARQGSLYLPSLLAILESFDLERASRRNESLRRFVRKFLEPLGRPTPRVTE